MSGFGITNFPADCVIAIPAYKAEKELASFLPHLLKFVSSKQIVALIDGDYDSSKEICSNFKIETIIHPENRGKGAALTTLFAQLADRFKWIITMDADGQHIPEDLPQILEKIANADDRCAIISGSRNRSGSSMPLLRRFSNGSTSWFISLITGQKINDSQCGYRAYRSKFVQTIHCKYTRFEMESEILIRLASKGFTVENVPVSTVYNGGPSHISHLKDTVRWIRAVLITSWETGKSKGNM